MRARRVLAGPWGTMERKVTLRAAPCQLEGRRPRKSTFQLSSAVGGRRGRAGTAALSKLVRSSSAEICAARAFALLLN